MITTYFILNKRDHRPHSEAYYIKIISESEQLAKDIMMMKYKQGYSLILGGDFKPGRNQILLDTIQQVAR